MAIARLPESRQDQRQKKIKLGVDMIHARCIVAHVGTDKPIEREQKHMDRVEQLEDLTGIKRQELVRRYVARFGSESASRALHLDNAALREALTTGESQAQVQPEIFQAPHHAASGQPQAPALDNLGAILAGLVQPYVNGKVDKAQVSEIVDGAIAGARKGILASVDKAIETALASIPPKRFEIVQGANVRQVEGLQHKAFETVVKMLGLGLNVYMHGPAGAGKTTIAINAGKALGVTAYVQSFSNQSSEFKLLGYQDATGTYRPSMFRQAFESGGVYLMDEGDSANPNVQCLFNSAIDNRVCAFPDTTIQAHPQFYACLGANTIGKGADRVYVGRNQLDGAFLNRFAFVEIDYDATLEKALGSDAPDWVARVQAYRGAADKLKVRHIISPRATRDGAKMLRAGFSVEDCEKAVVWQGLDTDTVAKIKTSAKVD